MKMSDLTPGKQYAKGKPRRDEPLGSMNFFDHVEVIATGINSYETLEAAGFVKPHIEHSYNPQTRDDRWEAENARVQAMIDAGTHQLVERPQYGQDPLQPRETHAFARNSNFKQSLVAVRVFARTLVAYDGLSHAIEPLDEHIEFVPAREIAAPLAETLEAVDARIERNIENKQRKDQEKARIEQDQADMQQLLADHTDQNDLHVQVDYREAYVRLNHDQLKQLIADIKRS